MNWILSVALLTLVTVGLGQIIARRDPNSTAESLWDIPRTAATYTSIVGMLAGFTVVVTMFFANLTIARSSPEFETVIGMLLVSFILFITAAMQFGTTPNIAERKDEGYLLLQRISYQMANNSYFCAIAISWLALKLFLDAIQLPFLASLFTWILLFAVFLGSLRMAQFLYRTSAFTRATCFLVPILGFGLAAVFYVGLLPRFPSLRSEYSEPLIVSVILFAAGVAGFLLQSIAITGGVNERTNTALVRTSDRIILGQLQAVSVLVALLWLTVAGI